MTITTRGLLQAVLLLIVCMLGLHRLCYIADVADLRTHSFISYYTASILLAQGNDASRLYDDVWFTAQVSQIIPDVEEYFSPNPPTTAMMLLPLAHLNYQDARIIWTVFNLIGVGGALLWILKVERFSILSGSIVCMVILLYQPLYANFKYGQVYGVLFVALTVIWYGYKHHFDKLTGILLALILIMKTAGLLLFPMLVVQQRWKALLWSGIAVVMIGVLSLPPVGMDSWLIFSKVLPEYSQRPSIAVTAYQSIPGFFKHHFAYHPLWNPAPLIDIPALATILSLGMIVILIAITFWKGRASRQTPLLFCALVVLGAIISPVTLDYHFAMILLPILLLAAQAGLMTTWQKGWFAVAIFLLAVDYPYQQHMYSATFLSLMAYPKLMGSLILWGVMIRLMSHQRDCDTIHTMIER